MPKEEVQGPTYEEATRCPKCQQPGDVGKKVPAEASIREGIRIGTMIHTVFCRNDRCKWFNTCWMVQVNPDGTVPPPTDHTGRPKKYQNFATDDQTRRIVDSIQRQLDAETQVNSEIRNPHG